jgi:hypothetical protein
MFLTRKTRAVTPFVGAILCIALLGSSASPATAYQLVSTEDASEYAFAADDDPGAVATLDVLAPPHDEQAESASGQPPDAVHTCVEPYDRPELACALASEATTFGSISSVTGMNVYRFEATIPGTTMRAELIEDPANHDVYLMGPGDVVLASAVGEGVSSKTVMAAVLTPGTHAIYVLAQSQVQPSRYGMRFAAVAPVASTAIPLLPGVTLASGDALAALPEQCPQTKAVHYDGLLATALQMFALPCDKCVRVDIDAEARIDDVPTPPKDVPSLPKEDKPYSPTKSERRGLGDGVQDAPGDTTTETKTPSSDVKPSSPPPSVPAPPTSVTSPPAGQQGASQGSAASVPSDAPTARTDASVAPPASAAARTSQPHHHADRVEPRDEDVPATVPTTRANSSADVQASTRTPNRGTGAQSPTGAEAKPSC